MVGQASKKQWEGFIDWLDMKGEEEVERKR